MFKYCELYDHLGNVITVVTDRKYQNHCDGTVVFDFLPDIVRMKGAKSITPEMKITPPETENEGRTAHKNARFL